MNFNFIKDYKPDNNPLIILVSKAELANLEKIDFLKSTSIAEVIKNFDFKAEEKEILELKAFASFKNLILIGLGEQTHSAFITKIGGLVADYGKKEVALNIKILADNNIKVENILLGLAVKAWGFDKYISDEKSLQQYKLKDVNLLHIEEKAVDLNSIKTEYEGITFAKNLVNEPANVLYPATYVEKIKELEALGVEVEVLDRKKLKELKMESFLAVGQGSDKESFVVIMKYMNGKKDDAPVAFVGKGVTFDTGGYSLKPSMAMIGMTKDMAGSAAVAGTMKTLALRKAKVNAVGVVGLVENSVNGSAMKPGDIVKAMNGKTIEILNTDAEGRLVLADILYYTSINYKPKVMINLATLTGAIIVSLGAERAGLFSNNDELASNLLKAGEESGDLLWQMPLGDEYKSPLKATIADLQNISLSPRIPGSIFAAKFLEEFVNDSKWAHLDIAGVADTLATNDLHKKGATAFGVRLLNKLVEKYYE